MKVGKKSVTSTSYTQATSAYARNAGVRTSPSIDDSVDLSRSVEHVARAVAMVSQVPDVRMEAIRPIQAELDQGTYHRDEVKVAQKVIEDHLTPSLPR